MDVQDYRCPDCLTGLIEFTTSDQCFICDECGAEFSIEEVDEGLWED